MTVEHVEFLVEEPSMEQALSGLLPKLLGGLSWRVYSHRCKQDLQGKLLQRLRGYASWLPETWRIVVIVDRDDDDCLALKAELEQAARTAGLVTRSQNQSAWQVVNRLAIEELEAWYFGDWRAVRAAYPKVSQRTSSKSAYRDPDAIRGGTWEALERALQNAGYFKSGLRKIELARSVAAHMVPDRNTSRSFQTLRSALFELHA